MVIQVEKIWLFETEVVDPYFFEKVDGVEVTMESDTEIRNINIDKATFFVGSVGKGGLSITKKYGGENVDSLNITGKTVNTYDLEFNLPVVLNNVIDQMIGREFSILIMKRDRTHEVCFGRFVAENLKIDNEVQQRVSMKCENTQSKFYKANTFNFSFVETNLTECNLVNNEGGFDYEFDFLMN